MGKIVEKVKEELLKVINGKKRTMKELVKETGITAFGISPILHEMEAEGIIKVENEKAKKIYSKK